MDKGWVPPVAAWQARFGSRREPVACAYIGAQSLDEGAASAAIDRLALLIDGSDVERACFVDRQGYHNEVLVLYWAALEERDGFWLESAVADWWQSAQRSQNGQPGVWREMFAVRPSRFETLFSRRNARGSGRLAADLGEPVPQHGYWGGMRDRIADSAHDPLDCTGQSRLAEVGNAGHFRVLPHDGLCIIRSGQDWSACSAEERALYDTSVLPFLIDGLNYLSGNGAETGCLFSRFMQEKSPDGGLLQRSCGHVAFQSLAHLERWAHTHPTHLAIFDSFMNMAISRGPDLALSLWHEVFVLDAAHSQFEYIHCHAGTGLLPHS